MTEIVLIAAVGRQGQLGLNGGLPWGDDFKEDRLRFKRETAGGIVITGFKTYETCRHLDGTHDRIFLIDPSTVATSYFIENLNRLYRDRPLFIAGGAKTYTRWLPYITRFDITVLPYNGPCDTWMPPLFQRPAHNPDHKAYLQAQIAYLKKINEDRPIYKDPIGHRQRKSRIEYLTAELTALPGDS